VKVHRFGLDQSLEGLQSKKKKKGNFEFNLHQKRRKEKPNEPCAVGR
jgi:hypothetical protein